MIKLDIITKSGLLVFSYNFEENTLFLNHQENQDLDIIASLKTAAINALKQTQGETITAIDQVDYTLLLYEGILTYGILTTRNKDPVLYDFLRRIVLKFELLYTYELFSAEGSKTILKKVNFRPFKDVVTTMYDDLIGFDKKGLEQVLDILKYSNIANYIIYKTAFLHPVYMSISDHSISLPLHRITKIFRSLDDLSLSIEKEIISVEIDLEDIILNALRTQTHWIVCLSNPSRRTEIDIKYEVSQIKNYITTIKNIY